MRWRGIDIGQKRYGRVDAEVQELGLTLYVDAIVGVKRGDARLRPQPLGSSRLYRQPRADATSSSSGSVS